MFASSQVIEQRRNDSGVKQARSAEQGRENPVEPRHSQWFVAVETLEQLRPEIALQFRLADGTQCGLQRLAELLVVRFGHRVTSPIASVVRPTGLSAASFLRSIRTARNTRTLTTAAETPAAAAIFS